MEIKKITPQGFCKGVINALEIIEDVLNKYPKVYILGDIIHNKEINNKLKEKGAIIIDKSYIPTDGVIVLTAHGTSPLITNKLTNYVDATCPIIKKIHKLIQDNSDHDIVYIGKKNHPETTAVLGYPNVKLITSIEEIEGLGELSNPILLNQTTLSILFLDEISKKAKEKYPNIVIYNKICDATRKRQQAVLNEDFDICFVVGDKSSSNANELANLKANCHLIESYKDIDESILKGKIAITSASSTPDYLVDEVIEFIKKCC